MAGVELDPPIGAPRRQVLRVGSAATAAALLGATVGPAPATAAADPGRAYAATRVALGRTRASGIRAAEVVLPVRAPGGRAWTSAQLSTDDFALLGLSWPAHAPTPTLEVRIRSRGSWQGWRLLAPLDDRPDPDDEANPRHATQPLWVGSADGVQVRATGARPARVLLSLIRPDAASGDEATASPSTSARPLAAPSAGRRTRAGAVARPTILGRTDWSADERWRDGRATYNDTIQQVHVHHTVTGNDYSRAETPALIRGMYYYHTNTLGWSDIGYNFLVDRFGRIWEGRAGGIDKAVRGAHTLGFNTTSCGVSVIGNLEQVEPSAATLSAVSSIAAWKLSLYGRNPVGTTKVVSEGSDKFSRNRAVTLPVIDGHRDTNDTACPGRFLYARLDEIRQGAKALVDATTVPAVTITTPFAVSGDPTPGATLLVAGGAYTPTDATATYAWLRDGVPIRGAVRPRRKLTAADAGHMITAVVTLSAADHAPASQQAPLAEPVRYSPAIEVAARGTDERITVAVKVGAAGADATPATVDPGGTARIRVDVGAKVVPVVAGLASTTFRRKPRPHTILVTYSGSALVRPGTVETTYTAPARQ